MSAGPNNNKWQALSGEAIRGRAVDEVAERHIVPFQKGEIRIDRIGSFHIHAQSSNVILVAFLSVPISLKKAP